MKKIIEFLYPPGIGLEAYIILTTTYLILIGIFTTDLLAVLGILK